MTTEEQRHTQLMKFMSEFRISMDKKLDTKLEEIVDEMKSLKEVVDKNEEENNRVLTRMDGRMKILEK